MAGGNIPPSVTTSIATLVTAVSATINGEVIDSGQVWDGFYYAGTITERGFYWGIDPDPATNGTKIIIAGTTTGVISSALTTLSSNTTYYFVAYCTSDSGTGYGSVLSFVYNVDSNTLEKNYIYKVYRNNQYLGVLPNVTSEFAYDYEINNPGTSINITCPISADTAGLEPPTIDDEFGNPIQDENGNNITMEYYPDVVGNGSVLFRNDNRITVTEISHYHPNGKQVFSGYIERWIAGFGGDSGEIELIVYSDGEDLSNMIVTGGDTLDQSQATQDGSIAIKSYSYGGWIRAGQTFTVGAGITTLSSISVWHAAGALYKSLTLEISGVAKITKNVSSVVGTPTEAKFSFVPVMTVTPGQVIEFHVYTNSTAGIPIYYKNSNVYADGTMLRSDYAGGSGGGEYIAQTGDLYFKTYYGGTNTKITYTSQDPTNIVVDGMSRYNSYGGVIQLGDYDLTTVSASYEYNMATVLELIDKSLEMSPSDWYWRINFETNELDFLQTDTTAKWTLVKGLHINELELSASIEEVKNVLYFSGGLSGTYNLFSKYSDSASITEWRPRLERKSDNRITLQATLNTIGNSFIAKNKNENYQTAVTLIDGLTDITKYQVGDTVGFSGFAQLVDELVLQIVRISRKPTMVKLYLGKIPPQMSRNVKNIENKIIALETVDNPTAPV